MNCATSARAHPGHGLVAEVRDRAVRAGGWAVRQPGGSDEHPLRATLSDDGLLPVLVGIDLPQQGRQEEAVVDDTRRVRGCRPRPSP